MTGRSHHRLAQALLLPQQMPNQMAALEPGQQERLEEETRRLVRRRTVVACWLAISIPPLYLLSDCFLYSEHWLLLGSCRFAGVVLAAAILIVVRSPVGEMHAVRLGQLLGIEVGLVVSAIPVLLVGYQSPYYVGFVLVILAMALLMPWPTPAALTVTAVLVAMYGGAALAHGRIDRPDLFLTNASFIVTAGIVALVGMRMGAVLRLREFRTRCAMEETLRHRGELAKALEQRTKQLGALNQEMEDLLYVASHDLRAPLINVQGFSRELRLTLGELRREHPMSPESRALFADIDESIEFILTAVARMDGLIGSLLNVSRIATRTNPTDVVPLGPMVDTIIDTFRYQLDQRQITVAIGNLPEVIGDPLRLNQAISNLVDNAIKYIGDRPIRRIEIGASTQNGSCACYVRDSGPGVPKDKQEAIFRLFQRLENGAGAGEGLGLTLVRKIIEKHGGRVWLEASPERGSTFWFTLQPAIRPALVSALPRSES